MSPRGPVTTGMKNRIDITILIVVEKVSIGDLITWLCLIYTLLSK
jgi:hypothetical protein